MPSAPHVLFAGDRKAGRFLAGFAVANQLTELVPDAEITFVGSGDARERHMVRAVGRNYASIPAQAWPENPLQALRFITDSAAGYVSSRWMLREQQVSAVVGLGGAASATLTRAAAARGLPVIVLEQNAVASPTARWLSRSSTTICAAFDQVRSQLHVNASFRETGYPARLGFELLYRAKHLPATNAARAGSSVNTPGPRSKRLLILGGATGGQSINQQMPAALQKLSTELTGWQIVHQTGEGWLTETESLYRSAGVDALVVSAIDEMASVLFECDLVVSRAGGATLAELSMAGVPAVLAPYPDAADDHQSANASIFSAAGAARIVDERANPDDRLASVLVAELRTLLADEPLRGRMAQQALSLAKPAAAADIAEIVCDELGGARRQAA